MPLRGVMSILSRSNHAALVEGERPDKRTAPVPPGWRFGVGLITPHCKNLLITETGNYLRTSYNGSSTATCCAPDNDFIMWESNRTMGKGQSRKEACWEMRSLANLKRKVKIGS